MGIDSIEVKRLMGKFLNKFGIKSYYEMTAEEKQTYINLENTLRGRKLTDDDAKEFWSDTVEQINDKLVAENLTDKERDFLLVELRLVRKIINFIDTPEIQSRNAKIMIESQLQEN